MLTKTRRIALGVRQAALARWPMWPGARRPRCSGRAQCRTYPWAMKDENRKPKERCRPGLRIRRGRWSGPAYWLRRRSQTGHPVGRMQPPESAISNRSSTDRASQDLPKARQRSVRAEDLGKNFADRGRTSTRSRRANWPSRRFQNVDTETARGGITSAT